MEMFELRSSSILKRHFGEFSHIKIIEETIDVKSPLIFTLHYFSFIPSAAPVLQQ